MAKEQFGFSFLGAGDATYFEWAEVHVVFRRAPTSAEKKAIAKGVPPPLRDSIEWKGTHLVVASGQDAHVLIAETYPESGEDEEEAEVHDNEDDAEGRWVFAKSSQVLQFNEEIELWLRFAHEQCPVLLAFRQEDAESGGTKLSAWHKWSVKRVPKLLPRFKRVLESDDEGGEAYVLRGILEMARGAKVKLPKAFAEWLEPAKKELACLAKGDGKGLSRLLSRAARRARLEALGDAFDADKPKHRAALVGAADALLAQRALPDDLALGLAHAMTGAHAAKGKLLGVLKARAAKDAHLGDTVAYVAFGLFQRQRFEDAIDLFDAIVDADGLALTAYNNALGVLLEESGALRVGPTRAMRIMKAALPHGKKNPSIHHNAACVSLALGRSADALRQIELAAGRGHDKKLMKKDRSLFPLKNHERYKRALA